MTKQEQHSSILGDKDRLTAFYLEVLTNLRYVVDKIWASARFFATLVSALVSVSVGSAIVLAKGEAWLVSRALLGAVVSVIPILLIGIAVIGFLNLKREYRRYLEVVVVAAKLQEVLGLNEPIETTRFPKDKTLLPSRYSRGNYVSSEEFVDSEFRRRGNLYWYLKLRHGTYAVIGLLLVAAVWTIVGRSAC